jgi:hypothetical protein
MAFAVLEARIVPNPRSFKKCRLDGTFPGATGKNYPLRKKGDWQPGSALAFPREEVKIAQGVA